MDAAHEGVIRLPGEARRIDVGGFEVLVLAGGEDTAGAFSLIETGEDAVGAGPPMHIHRDAAESFFVLAGAYTMHVGGRSAHCPAGSFVHVPRGLRHTFQSAEAGSRKLNLYTPAAMVGYFDELADAIARDAGEAELAGIAERYAMDVVGPVPEGYV